MEERNAGLPPERRIEFRVGIHLGDVMVESDGDLMGDGVNIAARLEGIARPGGICISEDARRQVCGKIAKEFTDLGEQSLKNIAQPVRAFALNPSSSLRAERSSEAGAAKTPPQTDRECRASASPRSEALPRFILDQCRAHDLQL